ncbi:MAG: phosphorylase family protein [Syntrophorhabdaceae bacterium]
MKRFYDPSEPILGPRDLVRAFTKKNDNDLALPERAIITFTDVDRKRLTAGREYAVIEPWLPLRNLYLFSGTRTITVRSFFGGPNIAALVEELSAFGVKEFILWGYCGGISTSQGIGDVCIAGRAFREDGVSYHYLDQDDDFVESNWAGAWDPGAKICGFQSIDVWTTDALYRETRGKILEFALRGMSAVEMETASLYAVCNAKGLKAVSFLVVSDLFTGGRWLSGFHTQKFKEGVKKLSRFVAEQAIL